MSIDICGRPGRRARRAAGDESTSGPRSATSGLRSATSGRVRSTTAADDRGNRDGCPLSSRLAVATRIAGKRHRICADVEMTSSEAVLSPSSAVRMTTSMKDDGRRNCGDVVVAATKRLNARAIAEFRPTAAVCDGDGVLPATIVQYGTGFQPAAAVQHQRAVDFRTAPTMTTSDLMIDRVLPATIGLPTMTADDEERHLSTMRMMTISPCIAGYITVDQLPPNCCSPTLSVVDYSSWMTSSSSPSSSSVTSPLSASCDSPRSNAWSSLIDVTGSAIVHRSATSGRHHRRHGSVSSHDDTAAATSAAGCEDVGFFVAGSPPDWIAPEENPRHWSLVVPRRQRQQQSSDSEDDPQPPSSKRCHVSAAIWRPY